MDVSAYLERIGYEAEIEPTAATLAGLHRAHLFAVPFETISIHEGERIELDPRWLYDKIVIRRRGGFCYELNGLFAELLVALGFEVTRLAGRVFTASGELGIPFDHMGLVVQAGDGSRWFADVGFGDSLIDPLPFAFRGDTESAGRSFRLRPAELDDAVGADGGEHFDLLERRPGQSWRAQCRFDRVPRRLDEFLPGCDYHQSSPESPFADRLLCSLPRPGGGRTTVRNFAVLETDARGGRSERPLANSDERRTFLAQAFGVEL